VVVVDCEAVAIADIERFIQPARNLKDPAKIAASIAERAEMAATYPWTARIVALGWCHETDEVPVVRTCNHESFERTVLREFWSVVWNGHTVERLVTFNGRRYDLPMLQARSMLLGVPCPELNLDRYRSPHVDLMDRLTWHGTLDARSLKFFAQIFGLNVDDAFSGALVAELVATGNWDAVIKHCQSDVDLTRQLAERMGVMRPRPVVAA
jgi:uncharacterized protein YprB with RNaseH-like and TPR domain